MSKYKVHMKSNEGFTLCYPDDDYYSHLMLRTMKPEMVTCKRCLKASAFPRPKQQPHPRTQGTRNAR